MRMCLLGIFVAKLGKIIPKTKLGMVEEGLTVPKESTAAATGEALPLREPKSCEKPPIPMLSSLLWDDQSHQKKVER